MSIEGSEAKTIAGKPRIQDFVSRIQSFSTQKENKTPQNITANCDGNISDPQELILKENTITHNTLRYTFTDSGLHACSVKINDDLLLEDNTRYFTSFIHKQIKVLIVNGDPSGVPKEDETFYLQRAIQAAASEHPAPIIIDSHKLIDTNLSDFDVIMLAGVASISPAKGRALTTFVNGGGGLLITSTSDLDTSTYNEYLGDILPLKLGQLKTISAEQKSGLTLSEIEHPILSLFYDSAQTGLTTTKTRSYISGEAKNTNDTLILLSHEDGAPILAATEQTNKRVLYLAISIDRDLADLPIRPGFVPLVKQMMTWLGRELDIPKYESVLVSQTKKIKVPEHHEVFSIIQPNGQRKTYRTSTLNTSQLNYTQTDMPGHYRLVDASDNVLDLFSVNVDARESDLRRLTTREGFSILKGEIRPEDIQTQTAANFTFQGKDGQRNVVNILMLIMLIALFMESLLRTWRPSR